jgi:hypothetical protein
MDFYLTIGHTKYKVYVNFFEYVKYVKEELNSLLLNAPYVPEYVILKHQAIASKLNVSEDSQGGVFKRKHSTENSGDVENNYEMQMETNNETRKMQIRNFLKQLAT